MTTPTEPQTIDPQHLDHMRAALALARRGLGRVAPNPAVGCVLVKNGQVVGRGWTQPGGRPHAETEALARAGAAARGGTAYVTLEPCDHHGQTGPCCEALIEAGIARAFVALMDPDERVAGGGLRCMREAGIEVETGLCAEAAAELNAGFLTRITAGRPLFTLKTASTLDGRIGTEGGNSRWITGEAARRRAHLLRAQHDVVMVGSGTALADDPMLTCRLPGLDAGSPIRVVVDSRLRLPLGSKLVASAREHPTWVLTLEGHASASLEDAGVQVIVGPPGDDGSVDLSWAALELGALGITRVLVEGGGMLAAGLLRHDLIDRLAWFRAPVLVGAGGIPAVGALDVGAISEAPRFQRVETIAMDTDLLEIHRRMGSFS